MKRIIIALIILLMAPLFPFLGDVTTEPPSYEVPVEEQVIHEESAPDFEPAPEETKDIEIPEDTYWDRCRGASQDLMARRGCCSWHGGVCGCDKATDRIVCCDGTHSPTCRCSTY